MKRIIACLDLKAGKVVKGIKFQDVCSVGDPLQLARAYDKHGADEIALLDIAASVSNERTLTDVLTRVAGNVSVPLVAGGGIGSVDDVNGVMTAGADKVVINTAAVRDPLFVCKVARHIGRKVVVAIDFGRVGDTWHVFTRAGMNDTGRRAVDWAATVAELGACELLVTSVDCDGTKSGYDIAGTRAIAEAVDIPVVASGGAGDFEDIYQVLTAGGADAALAASIFHYRQCTPNDIKKYLHSRGVEVKLGEMK